MNMGIAKRSCPVCYGEEVELLHRQDFVLPDEHPLANGYWVVMCQQCGFIYADVSSTQKQYDEFYATQSKYEDSSTSTGGGETCWDNKRLSETASIIQKNLDCTDTRILEIGCANGGLLHCLKSAGYSKVVGVDPSATCVKTLQSRGIQAIRGTLNSLPSSLGIFDCVILNHVLEHVYDPRSDLSSLVIHLAEKGILYVEVPNAALYHQFDYAPFQEFNTEHINYLSEGSLVNLLGVAGFGCRGISTKMIAISAGRFYPALFGFFQPAAATVFSTQKDARLREKILDYIDHSRQLMGKIQSHLKSSLSSFPSVIVWGTGQLTMKLLRESYLGKVEIVRFVDSNPIYHGKTMRGVPIVSPSEILRYREPIVVASLLHDEEITACIRSLRLPNRVIHLGAN